MNLLKTFAAASIIALASFGANASQITNSGVTWDPDFDNGFADDFISNGYYSQYYVAGTARGTFQIGDKITNFADVMVEDTLEGFGYLTDLNDQSRAQYCVTCEVLTFTFTDFELVSLTSAGAPIFSGGSAAVYADTGGIPNSYASASDDLLWLDLVPVFNPLAGDGAGSTIDVGGTITDGTNANAYFSVVGGSAMSSFDTNGELFGSDLSYNSVRGGDSAVGAVVLRGNSIPEPTSLAIFGLGLLGLAGAARRKA